MTALHVVAASVMMLAVSTPAPADQERSLDRRVVVAVGQAVEIRGLRGSEIEFKTWNESAVRVQLRVSASSSDEEWEARYLNGVSLTVDSTADRVTVTYREPDERQVTGSWIKRLFNFRWYRKMNVSGVVYVPRKNAFTTDLRYGAITLAGIEGEVRLDGESNTVEVRDCPRLVEIRNDYGRTKVERSGGPLRVEGKSGTVTIDEHRGDLEVQADYSTVEVARVEKRVTISTTSGVVNVADIGGDVKIDADYSRVSVERVAGMVDVSDKSGSIRLRSIDGVTVDGAYSEIDISGVAGKRGAPIAIRGQAGRLSLADAVGTVEISNSYSTVALANIQGNVSVKGQNTTIEAEKIVGDWNSQTSYAALRVRDLKAENVQVSNSSSDVRLELATAPARLNVRHSYGNVDVKVPRSLSAKVRLKAEYGEVRTDLPVDVEKMGSGALATGSIGAAGGTFTVDVKSGDISVRQR